MPAARAGLGLRILLDRPKYTSNEVISLEVMLSSERRTPVVVARRISPNAHLVLEFRDAAGKVTKSEQRRVQLALLANPRDFVQLDPGYLYGVRLRLVPRQREPAKARYYSLIYPPALDVHQEFFLPGAGDYSLTVTYTGVDGGHMAGVTAWVGTLESNKVSFSISP